MSDLILIRCIIIEVVCVTVNLNPRERSPQVRLIVMLVLFLIVNAPGIAAAQSRQPVNDVELVERTMLELTRLQERGNGNELYDWLAEAARDRIPRESFSEWVDDQTAFVPEGDPKISDITFESWVWPVTGASFPNVATVTATQKGTRLAVSVEETTTYHLLNDGVRWRWLFGETLAEVEQVANQPHSTLAYASEFTTEPYQTIDEFWATIFADADLDYLPILDVVAVDYAPFETGCGTETDIAAAGIYLCLLDRTIYFSAALKSTILAGFGEIGWHTIIAHEWSHQIQSQLGIIYVEDPELYPGAYILELETQADCMTGIYMQDQLGLEAISRTEVQESRRVLATYGDLELETWDDPVAHGTSEQRVASFNLGFHNGFVGCGLDLDGWVAG